MENAQDYAALAVTLFLFCLLALVGWALGLAFLRAAAVPLGLLVFMVPLTTHAEQAINAFLQRGSAAAGVLLFNIVGTPVYAANLRLQLPGISLEVAPECSGIHSSLALLIVSLLAGYLLLTSPWRRAVLAAAVLPLALLRNGFRIFVIGELCVRQGPEMINSNLHRHGGPLFFIGSIVPFALLAWFLVRSERKPSSQR